jgi:hypothetical protein
MAATLMADEERVELRGVPYRFALLRGTELRAALPLFADAFPGRPFTVEGLAAKYACAYGDFGGFLCVAFTDDGEPAGSVGVLPWRVRRGELLEGAGQMVDVATHTSHRGRGLFVHLADLARTVCDRGELSFLFGFPNEEAYPIWINKLGYVHSDDLVHYRRPVRTLWLERVAGRVATLGRPYRNWVDRTLGRYAGGEVLENSLVAEGFAAVERDSAFFAYKAGFTGSRIVALRGRRAWLRASNGFLVGDLEPQDASGLHTVAGDLERLARRLGIHQIVFQASRGTRFSALLDAGFTESPGLPVIHRDIRSQIPPGELRYSFGDFDNF